MEEMKIIITGISQELVEGRLQCLKRKKIVITYRGNKIDLEIKDKELAIRILKEEYDFVL